MIDEEKDRYFQLNFEEGRYYVVEVAATAGSPIRRAVFCITSKENKVGILYYGGKGFPNLVKVNYESLAYISFVHEIASLIEDFPTRGRLPEEI